MSRIRYGTNAKTLPGQVENISRKYKTPPTERVTNDPLKYHLLATCCTLPGQHLVSRVTHGDKEKLKMEMMEIGQGRASQYNNNNCSTPVIARNKREPFFNCHPPSPRLLSSSSSSLLHYIAMPIYSPKRGSVQN